MNDVMVDGQEWREMREKLTRLEKGQVRFETRMDAFDTRQKENHKTNSDEIADVKDEVKDVKTALYGIVGDAENVGVIRNVDRMLTYGKSGALWLKALAGLIALLIAYLGLRLH